MRRSSASRRRRSSAARLGDHARHGRRAPRVVERDHGHVGGRRMPPLAGAGVLGLDPNPYLHRRAPRRVDGGPAGQQLADRDRLDEGHPIDAGGDDPPAAVADRGDRGGLVAGLHDHAAMHEPGRVGVLDAHPADQLRARGRHRSRGRSRGHLEPEVLVLESDPAPSIAAIAAPSAAAGSSPCCPRTTIRCSAWQPAISAPVVERSTLSSPAPGRRSSRSGPPPASPGSRGTASSP